MDNSKKLARVKLRTLAVNLAEMERLPMPPNTLAAITKLRAAGLSQPEIGACVWQAFRAAVGVEDAFSALVAAVFTPRGVPFDVSYDVTYDQAIDLACELAQACELDAHHGHDIAAFALNIGGAK